MPFFLFDFFFRDIKGLVIFCWVRFPFCIVGRDLFAFDEDWRACRFLNILRETTLVLLFEFFFCNEINFVFHLITAYYL